MTARALVVALLALALAAPAGAATPRTSLPDVEDEVMCVTCNVPLSIADSPQADRQRAFIARLVREGRTKEQVKAALVSEYGRNVLAVPRDEGFGRAAWLVPAAALALALGVLAVLLPRWRRRAVAAPGRPGRPMADADRRRLEEELARLDG